MSIEGRLSRLRRLEKGCWECLIRVAHYPALWVGFSTGNNLVSKCIHFWDGSSQEFENLLENRGVGWCVKTNIVRSNRIEHEQEIISRWRNLRWIFWNEGEIWFKNIGGEYSWGEILIQIFFVPGQILEVTDGFEIWNRLVKK